MSEIKKGHVVDTYSRTELRQTMIPSPLDGSVARSLESDGINACFRVLALHDASCGTALARVPAAREDVAE
jgi:hypothetical protein